MRCVCGAFAEAENAPTTPALALDAGSGAAYKRGHDACRSNRHPNYMPGALIFQTRRVDRRGRLHATR